MVDTIQQNLDIERPLKVFLWRDIVVLCDDGRSCAEDYASLLAVSEAQQRKYPHGFGVLNVIPRNAVPPPEPVRRAINETLERVEGSVRCMCWLIEGSGFQAAMVRAVLTGMRLFTGAPYARHVSTDLEFGLTWILSFLEHGSERLGEVEEAARYVRAQLALVSPSINGAAL